MTVEASISIGCKGFVRLEAIKVKTCKDGSPILDKNGNYIEISKRILADWFPNKLLDSGRNRMGTNSDWLNCVQVGTNNTTPQATDTGLLGYIAGSSSIQETITGAEASSPYFAWKRRRWRYGVGETAANLSEVGVGWSTANGAYLVSRALIVDGDGNPTTVTPLADEILDVWYEFRYYPPETDVTGTVTLNGVDYNYTVRASEVTVTETADLIGTAIGEYSPGLVHQDWNAYDGTIGTLTQAPNGLSANGTQDPTNSPYSNNSYQRRMSINCGTTGWNLAGGIRSIRIKTTAGRFQTQFGSVSGDNKIPKTDQFTMDMAWIISWSEAP